MQEADRRDLACELELDLATDAVLVLQVAPALTAGEVSSERLVVTDGHGAGLTTERHLAHGGRSHIVSARAGTLRVTYEGTFRAATPAVAPPDPRSAAGPGLALSEEEIVALRPSRYCPSDALSGFAALTFPDTSTRAGIARAVTSWVFEHLLYGSGSGGGSRPIDSAVDTLLSGAGVCRDFAHLAIALCRARGVPARFAAVYAPGLSPMDFHAVAEVHTEHGWEVLDSTRRAPRSSLVRIATGRDAADAAFVTTLSGTVELTSVSVLATSGGLLPPDDHVAPVHLA